MLGRLRSSITIAASLAAIGTLALSAAASPASATTVAPHQYFTGEVFGITSSSNSTVINVACAGPETMGHPFPGQYVEVKELFPPITGTTGYTGDDAKQINADLSWGTASPVLVASFTQYSVPQEIPTTILVPCSGTGIMSFNPEPDVAATSSLVDVTFLSTGV